MAKLDGSDINIAFNGSLDLDEENFDGFISVSELQRTRCRAVPDEPGVYLVIRREVTPPIFLQESIGGHFKGRNPTVLPEKLEGKWLEQVNVLYIGKAGNLQNRIKQYMDFGLGKRVGHHGGRYIWQLEDSQQLQLCWRPTPSQEPAFIESQLLQLFSRKYGAIPFANLRY